MKEIFIPLLLFIALIPATVQAQAKVEGGLKLGLNVSDFAGRGLDNHEVISRTSYHVGLLAEFTLISRWNLQPELLYSEQGFGFQNAFQEEIEIKLNYLQLPVLVEYHLFNDLFVQGGPQVSYLLKEDYNSVSRRYNYNRFDFSVGLGLEYVIRNFFVYGRYTAGLNRIFNNSGERSQNRVLQAGVGFIFK